MIRICQVISDTGCHMCLLMVLSATYASEMAYDLGSSHPGEAEA
jgi:hypothetical protein